MPVPSVRTTLHSHIHARCGNRVMMFDVNSTKNRLVQHGLLLVLGIDNVSVYDMRTAIKRDICIQEQFTAEQLVLKAFEARVHENPKLTDKSFVEAFNMNS